MPTPIFSCVAVVAAAVVVLVVSCVTASPNSAKFMCGVSGTTENAADIKLLADGMHVTHCRRYMMWKYAQPVLLKKDFDYAMSVADVKSDPAKYIDAWSKTVPRWDGLDRMISSLCADLKRNTNGRRTITPIIEVVEGDYGGLPVFKESANDTSGKLADPCVIGVQPYLAHTYRWVRAVIRRYVPMMVATCGVNASDIIAQIENEFNEAGLSVLYGQRQFCRWWFNESFLTLSLSTLYDAVKDEQPAVRTTMNLHTDVPKDLLEMIHLGYSWYGNALVKWEKFFDIVSLDAYPNMYQAAPIRADEIGDRIRNITHLLTDKSKKVFVMETGMPVDDEHVTPTVPVSGWSVMNFNQSQQAAYATAAVRSVVAAGGVGLLFFEATRGAGMLPPPGGYDKQDRALFREARLFLESQNITQLVDYFSKGAEAIPHLEELFLRAPYFLTRADKQHGWSLLDEQGKGRLAFDALAKEYAGLCG